MSHFLDGEEEEQWKQAQEKQRAHQESPHCETLANYLNLLRRRERELLQREYLIIDPHSPHDPQELEEEWNSQLRGQGKNYQVSVVEESADRWKVTVIHPLLQYRRFHTLPFAQGVHEALASDNPAPRIEQFIKNKRQEFAQTFQPEGTTAFEEDAQRLSALAAILPALSNHDASLRDLLAPLMPKWCEIFEHEVAHRPSRTILIDAQPIFADCKRYVQQNDLKETRLIYAHPVLASHLIARGHIDAMIAQGGTYDLAIPYETEWQKWANQKQSGITWKYEYWNVNSQQLPAEPVALGKAPGRGY